MRFILLSDVHASSKTPMARKDDISKTWREKMDFVFFQAKRYRAIILQAGDLSDKSRDWGVLDGYVDLFNKYPDVKMFCTTGQHDLYMRSAINEVPTAMSILLKTKRLHVLSNKPEIIGGVKVYGAGWKQSLPKPKRSKNILVIHANISDEVLFPSHRPESTTSILQKHQEFDLILAGDVHRHVLRRTSNNRILVNTGPMLRMEAEEYNLQHKPCCYLYNSETKDIKKIAIPHKPAREVLSFAHKNKKETRTNKTLSEAVNLLQQFKKSGKTTKEKIYEAMQTTKLSDTTIKIITEALAHEP